MCEAGRGTPACTGHGNDRCAARTQTDLLHTPAFQALADPRSFLPNLAAAAAEEEAESRDAAAAPAVRGPERTVPEGEPRSLHVSRHARGRGICRRRRETGPVACCRPIASRKARAQRKSSSF